jgi:hypothetical protein
MELSTEKHPTGLSKPGPLSAVFQIVSGFLVWLTAFLTLTEEERTQAGIYLKNNRHE